MDLYITMHTDDLGWCLASRVLCSPRIRVTASDTHNPSQTSSLLIVQCIGPTAMHVWLTVSNDTRVRADGLVKIIAMDISLNGLKFVSLAYSFFLANCALSSMSSNSSFVKSSKCRKCLPFAGGAIPLPEYVAVSATLGGDWATTHTGRTGRAARLICARPLKLRDLPRPLDWPDKAWQGILQVDWERGCALTQLGQ